MDHVRSLTDAHGRFDEIVKLGNVGKDETFDELPEDERLRRGERLAGHWEAIADECERSWATQLMFSSWTPAEMRAESAVWREGRDPRWI
jgi:hypothetical protein